ncbi:MAG: hypothetical protein ICV63_19110, partial [Coleofasciculus sp. Co-bin14]|nr:hypothetical protein [Coleofasciculus sp. Co-bin14]
MTKFDDLWQKYAEQSEAHQKYKETCLDSIRTVVNQLIIFLEWDVNEVYYVPLNQDSPINIQYSFTPYTEIQAAPSQLEKIVTPAGKVGFWNFGLGLGLGKRPMYPSSGLDKVIFIIPLLVGESNNSLSVRIGEINQQKFEDCRSDNKLEEISNCIFTK